MLAALAGLATSACADDPAFSLQLDLGSTWQARNKVQIPHDNQGDKFSLEDVAGSGP